MMELLPIVILLCVLVVLEGVWSNELENRINKLENELKYKKYR